MSKEFPVTQAAYKVAMREIRKLKDEKQALLDALQNALKDKFSAKSVKALTDLILAIGELS